MTTNSWFDEIDIGKYDSSYKLNGYGVVLSHLVEAFRPSLCVELGVLHGYSAVHIAQGLIHNIKHGKGSGRLECWDIWDSYPYKHGNMEEVQAMLDSKWIEDHKVSEFVSLNRGDAFTEAPGKYGDNSISMLHCDISNTGETVRRLMEVWDRKVRCHGFIVLEGGSDERDKEPWMVKYGKEPIRPELRKNHTVNAHYVWGTYPLWPSMTVLLKKWDDDKEKD